MSISAQPTPDRTRRASNLRRVVIGVVAVLLLVGLFDLSLGLILGLGHPVLITPDAACSYLIKPDQDTVRFFVHTHINQYGMRSDNLPAKADAQQLRIMFVGDSVTYGTTRVGQNAIFTEILQRELPAVLHRPVEVLNASASAWAPDNELSYIRSRGIFHSSLVVLVLNSGDLTQPRSTIEQVGSGLYQKAPASALSEFCERVGEVLRQHLPHAHTQEKVDAGDSAVDGADSVVQANLADLDSFDRLVSSQHAQMAVVYIPFRKDIPTASARSLTTLRTWTNSRHVPLLDMTAVEAQYSPQQINLDSGVHLNAHGHRLIAEALKRLLPQYLPHS